MKTVQLLIKPASGHCNMRCTYCFYVEEMKQREIENYGMMTIETLSSILEKVFLPTISACSIAFQGGEPTLVGLEFYKNFIRLVDEKNCYDCNMQFAIQTNGYALTKEWVQFFKKHDFLVGISLDGIEECHNQHRVDSKGDGTFQRVLHTIALLKQYEVKYNVLTVINATTVQYANRIYNFYKRNNIRYQQYIELVNPAESTQYLEEKLTPEIYGQFLIALFKKWYRDLINREYVSILYFEDLMDILCGYMPTSCTMCGICGSSLVVEADGSVYPCDFYVLDEWKLGNFKTDSLKEMRRVVQDKRFVEMSQSVPNECQRCKWYFLCRNGCRKNCEPVTQNQRGVNYYCKGYQMFFEYAYPYMQQLKRT